MGRLPADARRARLTLLIGRGVGAWVRSGVVLAGGFVAGDTVVGAFQALRHAREVAATDPSGADLYRTTAELDAGIALASVCLAALVWWLLRDPPGPRLP